jgi:hypothetical protein
MLNRLVQWWDDLNSLEAIDWSWPSPNQSSR